MLDRRQVLVGLAATAAIGPAIAKQAITGISAPERSYALLEGRLMDVVQRTGGQGFLTTYRFLMKQLDSGLTVEWEQTAPPQFDVGDRIQLKIEGPAGLGPLDQLEISARKL
jgi:hypothetical protein